MPTAVRRFCDHFATGPSGVEAQSNARMRVAISLSPPNGDTLVPEACVISDDYCEIGGNSPENRPR